MPQMHWPYTFKVRSNKLANNWVIFTGEFETAADAKEWLRHNSNGRFWEQRGQKLALFRYNKMTLNEQEVAMIYLDQIAA